MTQRNRVLNLVIVLLAFPLFALSQEPSLGVINGRATSLPKPAYPKHLQDLCAEGRVEVELLLDERGKVLETRPLSGDELLYEVAQDAAKLARFSRPLNQRVRSKGIVIYNFVPDRKCADVGNIYGRWRKTPRFSIHPHSIVQEETVIIVRLGIDVMNGKVIAAKAVGGHQFNRKEIEVAAMKIVFSPVTHWSPNVLGKGFIKLRVNPDSSVEPIK